MDQKDRSQLCCACSANMDSVFVSCGCEELELIDLSQKILSETQLCYLDVFLSLTLN